MCPVTPLSFPSHNVRPGPVPQLTRLTPAGAITRPPEPKHARRSQNTPVRSQNTLARAKFVGHLTKCALIPQCLYVWALS